MLNETFYGNASAKKEAQISRLDQENQARLEEIYRLQEKLEFLEKDSQARLKEIHKRDEKIAHLQQELSLSIEDKILRKVKNQN